MFKKLPKNLLVLAQLLLRIARNHKEKLL